METGLFKINIVFHERIIVQAINLFVLFENLCKNDMTD